MKFAAEPKTWIFPPSFSPAALLLLSLFIIHGCASSKHDVDPTEGMPVAEIYDDAKAELDNKQYATAVKLYSKLIARYPYGPYAQQALLDSAYAYYMDKDYETAIVTGERFIKINPRHPSVDYAYYLRGLSAYSMEQSMLDKTFRQDPTERDSRAAKRAFSYFNELVTRYPNSRYASDAIQRMVYLQNSLGTFEIHVARFYLRKQAYLAAVNRAKYVLSHFQKTPAVQDALVIMVKAYRALDMSELADDALRVLELNNPNHPKLKSLSKANKKG